MTVITNAPQDVPPDLAAGFSIEPPVDGGASGGSDGYGAPPQVLGTVPAGNGGGSGPLDLSAIARGDRSGGQGGYDQGTLPGVAGTDGGVMIGGGAGGIVDPAPGLPPAVATAPLEPPPGTIANTTGPISSPAAAPKSPPSATPCRKIRALPMTAPTAWWSRATMPRPRRR